LLRQDWAKEELKNIREQNAAATNSDGFILAIHKTEKVVKRF
jgi:hypothetical protein